MIEIKICCICAEEFNLVLDKSGEGYVEWDGVSKDRCSICQRPRRSTKPADNYQYKEQI